MGKKNRQIMPFSEALSMVNDDLPDGAYFAMAHEFAGLDYGEGFDELAAEERRQPAKLQKPQNQAKKIKCDQCNRMFATPEAAAQHAIAAHRPIAAKYIKTIKCEKCDRKFATPEAKDHHSRIVHHG
jgi:phage FluMu protein Com